MKRTKFLAPGLVLLLAVSLAATARGQSAGTNASTLHSLWKVEGKTNTVYLLGSIHLMKPENYPLAAPIESAFKAAQVVAFETDMEKMEQPETQFKLLSKAGLPEGQTLKQQVSAEVYTNFSKHVEDAGLIMFLFEYLKPGIAAMTLELMQVQKLGFAPEYGMDKHFFERARNDGKQILAFETVDFQINLVTGLSKEEDELFMKTTLVDIDNTRKLCGEMMTAWQTGDAAGLQQLLNSFLVQAPAIYRRLVTDRNQRWVPKIEELLAGGKNAIVIVGAGHLVGSEGVVELLKKKGLKVTQL